MQKKMKNFYRYLGIGLVVSSLLFLLQPLFFLMLLPESYYALKSLTSSWTFYAYYGGLLVYLLRIFIDVWILDIGVILIQKNKYTKQILYATYTYIIYLFIGFLYNIPLLPKTDYIQMIIDLVVGILVYYFGISKDTYLSRIIKGKIKT